MAKRGLIPSRFGPSLASCIANGIEDVKGVVLRHLGQFTLLEVADGALTGAIVGQGATAINSNVILSSPLVDRNALVPS